MPRKLEPHVVIGTIETCPRLQQALLEMQSGKLMEVIAVEISKNCSITPVEHIREVSKKQIHISVRLIRQFVNDEKHSHTDI